MKRTIIKSIFSISLILFSMGLYAQARQATYDDLNISLRQKPRPAISTSSDIDFHPFFWPVQALGLGVDDFLGGPECHRLSSDQFANFIRNFTDQIQETGLQREESAERIRITVVRENCMNGINDRGFSDVEMVRIGSIYVGHRSHRKAVEFIRQFDENIDEINRLEGEIEKTFGIHVSPGGVYNIGTTLTSSNQYLSFLRDFQEALVAANVEERTYENILVIEENNNVVGIGVANPFGADLEETRYGNVRVGHRSAEALVDHLISTSDWYPQYEGGPNYNMNIKNSIFLMRSF